MRRLDLAMVWGFLKRVPLAAVLTLVGFGPLIAAVIEHGWQMTALAVGAVALTASPLVIGEMVRARRERGAFTAPVHHFVCTDCGFKLATDGGPEWCPRCGTGS